MSFADRIGKEKFSLVAEVDPPKGVNLPAFLDTVLSIKGRVGAVAVTDGAQAIMRMTPLAPCRLLIERNIEPVMILKRSRPQPHLVPGRPPGRPCLGCTQRTDASEHIKATSAQRSDAPSRI